MQALPFIEDWSVRLASETAVRTLSHNPCGLREYFVGFTLGLGCGEFGVCVFRVLVSCSTLLQI